MAKRKKIYLHWNFFLFQLPPEFFSFLRCLNLLVLCERKGKIWLKTRTCPHEWRSFIGEGFKNYSPRHVQILGHRISLCGETIFKASKRFLSFCSLEKCFVKITFQVLISIFHKFSLLLEVALYFSIFPSISDFILSSSSFFSRRCWIFSSYRSKFKMR